MGIAAGPGIFLPGCIQMAPFRASAIKGCARIGAPSALKSTLFVFKQIKGLVNHAVTKSWHA
jgi:hypothetical protein